MRGDYIMRKAQTFWRKRLIFPNGKMRRFVPASETKKRPCGLS